MIPAVCAASNASAISIARSSTFSSGSGLPEMPCFRVFPSRDSMAIKRLSVLLSDIVDRTNVRVIESRGCLFLALQSFDRVAAESQPVREGLQRNQSVTARVFSPVHHA